MPIGSDGSAAETQASEKKGGGLRSGGDVPATSQMYVCPRSLQLS